MSRHYLYGRPPTEPPRYIATPRGAYEDLLPHRGYSPVRRVRFPRLYCAWKRLTTGAAPTILKES